MFVFVIPNYNFYSDNQLKARFGQGKESNTDPFTLCVACGRSTLATVQGIVCSVSIIVSLVMWAG
jgi:hypothetical protein